MLSVGGTQAPGVLAIPVLAEDFTQVRAAVSIPDPVVGYIPGLAEGFTQVRAGACIQDQAGDSIQAPAEDCIPAQAGASTPDHLVAREAIQARGVLA